MSAVRLPTYLIPTTPGKHRSRIVRVVKQSTRTVVYPRPRSVGPWLLIGAVLSILALIGLRFA